jgi:hypothetical protein
VAEGQSDEGASEKRIGPKGVLSYKVGLERKLLYAPGIFDNIVVERHKGVIMERISETPSINNCLSVTDETVDPC